MKRAQLTHIALSKIRPGRNVRVSLHNIDGLAESLLQHGMLQPITVVPASKGDGVEVLFGHRRVAAARKAGMSEVPCFLRERGDEQSRLLTQVAENFDRDEMTALDEARVFSDLAKCGMTQTEIATKVRRSQAHVSRTLRLLEYPDCVQMAVHERVITVHDALSIPRALLADPDAMKTIDKATRSGTTLRAWIGKHAGEAAGRHAVPYWSMRMHQRYRDVARAAAKTSGVPLADWVEQAIVEKAAK